MNKGKGNDGDGGEEKKKGKKQQEKNKGGNDNNQRMIPRSKHHRMRKRGVKVRNSTSCLQRGFANWQLQMAPFLTLQVSSFCFSL